VTGNTPEDRHLSPQGFAEYLAADVPVVVPVPGEPAVSIFIDPGRERIGLRSPLEGEAVPPASPLENVHVSVVQAEGVRQLEVSATDPELFVDVYAMLCAIADRIQLEGNAPLDALDATLAVWARLLARRKRLSDDQEVGLFGELLLLRALLETAGEAVAIASWRGPLAEEHDFGFSGDDAEVKTTTAEARRHWINNLTQLVPTTGRPLWLVSVQITRAGSGHGESLPQLIKTIRSALVDHDTRKRCDEVLMALHWSDDQQELYPQRWTLRSAPSAYPIDSSFPALTSVSLVTLGWAANEITQVRYELDVTHRDGKIPAEPLASALQQLK
jgi:hypothetical protein